MILNSLLERLGPVIRDYKRHQGPNDNIFQNISPVFYSENFHSDLIAYFLKNPVAKRIFCEWILGQRKVDHQTLVKEFQDGEVIREDGRADIVLYSKDRTKALVIENKSNNAGDQERQLIRYFQQLSDRKVEVCGILYLNKYQLKEPDYTNWNAKEKNQIKDILVVAQLSGESGFIENVIERVINESNETRISALGFELRALFHTIVYGSMNMEKLESFVAELRSGDTLEQLKPIIEAYHEIPKFLAHKFKKHYEDLNKKEKTGYGIGIWRDTCLFIDGFYVGGKNFGIDVWFSNDQVDISLIVRGGGTDNDIRDLKNLRPDKWPFGTEMDNGRFRVRLWDRLNEEDTKKQIDGILDALKSLAGK